MLGKGDWLRLPTWPQRLLALYTLAFPLVQALTMLYVPISLWMMFFAKVPVLVAMLSSLPLYVLLVQFVISLVGLYEFTAVHRLRPSPARAALADRSPTCRTSGCSASPPCARSGARRGDEHLGEDGPHRRPPRRPRCGRAGCPMRRGRRSGHG